MAAFVEEPLTCHVCGATSKHLVNTCTYEDGSPDLDLRPPEMRRSTIKTWVHQCPVCGYAGSLTDWTFVTKEWLQSESYKNCNGRVFKSDLARQFYQAYMIYSYDNRRADAFHSLLFAAWSCDDCQDEENAEYCRKMALLHFDAALRIHPDEPDKWHVVKADIMRRAGMFEYVQGEYQFARYREETLNRIIAFQLKKAAIGDRKCYTVEEALEGHPGFLSSIFMR